MAKLSQLRCPKAHFPDIRGATVPAQAQIPITDHAPAHLARYYSCRTDYAPLPPRNQRRTRSALTFTSAMFLKTRQLIGCSLASTRLLHICDKPQVARYAVTQRHTNNNKINNINPILLRIQGLASNDGLESISL